MPFSKRWKSPKNLRVTVTEKLTFKTHEKGKGKEPQDVPWAISFFLKSHCLLKLTSPSKAPYTLSVKLSDFIVWRHTWRKNWVNCAVLTGNSAGLRTVFFQSSFTYRTAQFIQGIPQFPQFTCRHHDGIISRQPFLAIRSADEHRMIYSFSNTTSYSTFYAFFSYFRITLWPMWLANSERQPCFYPP